MGPVTRPGRSPCAAPAPAGPAQPPGPLRSAAPPRCGWAPRRCCWPARCGSPSAPTPSSCSSAGGDTAKGAASRVRRGGAAGRLRPGPGSVSAGRGLGGPGGVRGARSARLLAMCVTPEPLGRGVCPGFVSAPGRGCQPSGPGSCCRRGHITDGVPGTVFFSCQKWLLSPARVALNY